MIGWLKNLKLKKEREKKAKALMNTYGKDHGHQVYERNGMKGAYENLT